MLVLPIASLEVQMEKNWSNLAWVVSYIVVGLSLVLKVLRGMNGWYYERKAGELRSTLPPGDMGWPFIGNMWFFLRCFKSGNPESFVSSFVSRFGRTGIYRAFMFGSPTILVTIPETCKEVLMDDRHFKPGWPPSTVQLIGRKSFVQISFEEHKRLRRLTQGPVNGPHALSTYLGYIERIVTSSLENWAESGPVEFLTELRRLTFKIIMHIFLGLESNSVLVALEREYTSLNYGVRAMAINIPGFAFHRALKARKRLVSILQSIVDVRRKRNFTDSDSGDKDMMDRLMETEDENGRKLTDEEIIDILVMYLNAGHESSAHVTMWSTLLLEEHTDVYQKAKAEQEMIIKNRPAGQKGLTMQEIKQMKYLNMVTDEALRWVSFSSIVFREATDDVKINGYTVPKGWKVQVWLRNVHKDSEVYAEPLKFDPSRWEGFTPRAGAFVPFGGGSRLCPGNDLAKLEIAVFLHYFLRGYSIQRLNPNSALMHLPHPRPVDNCMAKIRKLS
ncbi:unnamed protein product [Victoria cruziana]